jgi:hypothetical protein
MQKILAVSLVALAFTTGFTCSKQAPTAEETAPAAATTETTPAQDQMGAPAEAPAATEAAPATETK